MAKEKVDLQTGLITEEKTEFGEKEIIKTTRPNGSKRVQVSFSKTVSMADKTGIHETDLNYLVKKYSPSDLLKWMAQKQQQPIYGHDFSKEPSRMHALNEQVRLDKEFEKLDPKIKKQFSSTLQFIKFVDDPKNKKALLDMGLITEQQIKELQPELRDHTTKTTQEDAEKKA